jgi:O-glycosyl hydrolase
VVLLPLLLLSWWNVLPASAPHSITVDPHLRHQTIEGWGGHVYAQGYAFLGTDTTLMRRMLDELATTHMRVRSIWYELEAANDNDDPATIDFAAIARGDTGLVHQELLFQQELSRRGVKLLFASWRFPSWMIGKPSSWRPTPDERPPLPPSMDEEYVESLAAYLLYARECYGIVFEAVSVANEPDIGIYIDGLDPRRLLRLSQMLRARLEARGYRTRFYLPDVAAADSVSRDYMQSFFALNDAAGSTCAVSYHSYRRSTDIVAFFAALGRVHHLSVWVTEQNDTHLASQDRHRWSHALKNAICLQELLVEGDVSLSLHFSYVMATSGGLGIYLPEEARWTPTYAMLQQFQNHIPPGSVRIETQPARTSDGVLSSAFLLEGGERIVCVLVNVHETSSPVHLETPSGRIELEEGWLSSASAAHQAIPASDLEGDRLILPPQSVVTVSARLH